MNKAQQETFVQLHQGDCLEIMKDIPDGSVDAIIADIPFGTTKCKWDCVIPLGQMWNELSRIVKANGAVLLFGTEPFSSSLRMSNIKEFKYDLMWKKSRVSGFANAKKMPLRNIEIVSVFYKSLPTYNPQGLVRVDKTVVNGATHKTRGEKGAAALNGGRFGNKPYVQEFTGYPTQVMEFSSESKTVHPTQKPVALMEYLINTYTNPGETVLDFTMGSGTTGVAAVNLGRSFIGIELDEGYFNIATERIEGAIAGAQALVDNTVEVV